MLPMALGASTAVPSDLRSLMTAKTGSFGPSPHADSYWVYAVLSYISALEVLKRLLARRTSNASPPGAGRPPRESVRAQTSLSRARARTFFGPCSSVSSWIST